MKHFSSVAIRLMLASLLLTASGITSAVQFRLKNGDVQGSFDTTLSYGMSFRTSAPKKGLGGLASQYGNRTLFNDKWDVVSNTAKASHDLQLKADNWGVFVRGNYFYDFEADTQPLPNAAENRAVHHGDITDAYAYLRLGPDQEFTFRLGKQVISWGENTFIGGSLNDINTIDITRLRQPGVELKDILLGTPSAYLTWTATESLTLEGFVLLGYDELKIDPVGSFFGTLDQIADGGGFANTVDGFGRPICVLPDGGSCNFTFGPAPVARASDDIPSRFGQFGLAIRYFMPELGNGFDFGLYYERLHDHNPQLSAVAGAGPAAPGRFFVDYAKYVERYGLSFNTIVGPWALGGEYSYRRNAPLQGANFAFVSGFGTTALGPGGTPVAPGTTVKGFKRYQRHQIQLTTQRLWGPMPIFRANQWNTIAEAAFGWARGLPGADNGLPDGNGFTRFDNVTKEFGGFQARSTLNYDNLFLNRINMQFKTALRWDVYGVSPELGGAKLFVQGRKSLNVGFDFDYKLNWKWGISHTFVWGGQRQRRPNGTRMVTNTDRDFLTINASYTF